MRLEEDDDCDGDGDEGVESWMDVGCPNTNCAIVLRIWQWERKGREERGESGMPRKQNFCSRPLHTTEDLSSW